VTRPCEVAEEECRGGADADRLGQVDPVPFPLAAIALGGEQVAGDECGGLVLQGEEAARAPTAVEPFELLRGETGRLVLLGLVEAVVR
jgi:hypothetical protein